MDGNTDKDNGQPDSDVKPLKINLNKTITVPHVPPSVVQEQYERAYEIKRSLR